MGRSRLLAGHVVRLFRIVFLPATVALQFLGKAARGDSKSARYILLEMSRIQQGFDLVSFSGRVSLLALFLVENPQA